MQKDLAVRVGAKRNELQQQMDMWWIVGEVAKGRTYKSIAEELNRKHEGEYELSAEMVRLEVNKCMVEWKRENMQNIDAVIGKELARLEGIEQKVYADYEKSKGLRAVDYAALMKRGMTIEEIDEMFGDRIAGDYHYMEVLLHVQMQKMKLLGIDKGNDVPQTAIVNYNFGSLSEEALLAMADQLQDGKKQELHIGVDEQ